MIILVRNSDNVVIFAEKEMTIDEKGTYFRGNISTKRTNTNHSLFEVDNLPDDFASECYTYNAGVFTITQIGLDHQASEQVKATAKATQEELEANRLALRASAEDMADAFVEFYDFLVTEDSTLPDRVPQTVKDKIANRKNLKQLIGE